MDKEFLEILTGFKRILGLMQKPEKTMLVFDKGRIIQDGSFNKLAGARVYSKLF